MQKQRALYQSNAILGIKSLVKIIVWHLSPSLFRKFFPYHPSQVFSVGVYSGDSLENLKDHAQVHNPVLSAEDVNDVPAGFVADPFYFFKDEQHFLFFEIMHAVSHRGRIGYATSEDGSVWNYQCVVLNEKFHMAYPYVFEDTAGVIHMVPDTPTAGVRLYRAGSFPEDWFLVKEILSEGYFSDSSPFFYEGRWWLFSAWSAERNAEKVLRLFHAEFLEGDWTEHPSSPLETDKRSSRPCGRVLVRGDSVIRFGQDCVDTYGKQVFACQVQLDIDEYSEVLIPTPILTRGSSLWRQGGMHHIDARMENGAWIAIVDGWRCPNQRAIT